MFDLHMAPIFPATKKNTPIYTATRHIWRQFSLPPRKIRQFDRHQTYSMKYLLSKEQHMPIKPIKQDVSDIKCLSAQDAQEVMPIYVTSFKKILLQVFLVWTNGVKFHKNVFNDEIGIWSEMGFSTKIDVLSCR